MTQCGRQGRRAERVGLSVVVFLVVVPRFVARLASRTVSRVVSRAFQAAPVKFGGHTASNVVVPANTGYGIVYQLDMAWYTRWVWHDDAFFVKTFPLPQALFMNNISCLLYTSPSPRDRQKPRMPSSA